jgi:archaellum biogenesis protein FlaJ (TadC family)
MLGRMRTLVLGIVWLFVAVTVSVSTYPFDPRLALSGTMICLFLVLGIIISLVYADMHRDTTLSHVTNTNPGELDTEFWVKLIGFGVAPFVGLLTTVFPEVADFVFSWLQPGLASLK